VALRVKESSPDSLVYEAQFCDRHGAVRLRMEDVDSACSAALNRLAQPGP
jgi:hypothetical protein